VSGDLVAFVAARLDEDEAAANEIHRPRHCGSVDRDGEFDPDPIWCGCDYPARVLREVEADRKLIAAYVTARKAVPPVDDWYEVADGVKVGLADGLEHAVKIRAARLSDHPGYDPSWAPEKAD
jgi:hypothetical protein